MLSEVTSSPHHWRARDSKQASAAIFIASEAAKVELRAVRCQVQMLLAKYLKGGAVAPSKQAIISPCLATKLAQAATI